MVWRAALWSYSASSQTVDKTPVAGRGTHLGKQSDC